MAGSDALGFGAVAVAVVFFGSNMLPVKQYKTGDGMFFQWVMCSAIFVMGAIVNLARSAPAFEPLAMLGGFLWCTGNVLSVPVINAIGLGLGLLVWGTSNLIMGWASGHFGLFGLKKQTGVAYPALNVIGLFVAIASLLIFSLVKTDLGDDKDKKSKQNKRNSASDEEVGRTGAVQRYDVQSALLAGAAHIDNEPLYNPSSSTPSSPYASRQASVSNSYQGDDEEERGAGGDESGEDASKSIFDALSPAQRRVFGFTGAIVAGCFFGVNFDPPQYLIDHAHEGHSKHDLDYVFPHFTGIFLTSTAYFMAYCAATKNKPYVNPQVILPGFVSGLMWGVAQCAWFLANQELSFVVSFPIITTGPGVVASLWGVFLFREIRGKRNLTYLVTAFAVTAVGVVLITLSKVL